MIAPSQVRTRLSPFPQAETRAPAVALRKTRQVGGQGAPLQAPDRARPALRAVPAALIGADSKRATRRWTLLWLPSIACALLCADALVRGRNRLRPDLVARLHELLPGAIGVLVVAGLATVVAGSPGTGRFGQRPSARWSALTAGPLSTLPVLFLARDSWPAPPLSPELDRWGFPCFFLAYLIAALSLVALARELRRLGSVLPSWRGAALGSVAGVWSALALFVHCPGVELEHLLVGHVLPICSLPLIGLLLAQRFLRIG